MAESPILPVRLMTGAAESLTLPVRLVVRMVENLNSPGHLRIALDVEIARKSIFGTTRKEALLDGAPLCMKQQDLEAV